MRIHILNEKERERDGIVNQSVCEDIVNLFIWMRLSECVCILVCTQIHTHLAHTAQSVKNDYGLFLLCVIFMVMNLHHIHA